MKRTFWIWIIILGALVGYELIAVLDGSEATWPLTTVTITYVPWWATMPLLFWLVYHFGKRYWK
jgi:hypothetical protein